MLLVDLVSIASSSTDQLSGSADPISVSTWQLQWPKQNCPRIRMIWWLVQHSWILIHIPSCASKGCCHGFNFVVVVVIEPHPIVCAVIIKAVAVVSEWQQLPRLPV
jgi:hypothetical protein